MRIEGLVENLPKSLSAADTPARAERKRTKVSRNLRASNYAITNANMVRVHAQKPWLATSKRKHVVSHRVHGPSRDFVLTPSRRATSNSDAAALSTASTVISFPSRTLGTLNRLQSGSFRDEFPRPGRMRHSGALTRGPPRCTAAFAAHHDCGDPTLRGASSCGDAATIGGYKLSPSKTGQGRKATPDR